MKQWYESLFENYAESYDKEIYTQGTLGECDFIEKEINYNKSCKIIDIGCGTGRHSIELTRRGYSVRGVDLSANQIDRARSKAEALGLAIDFSIADARSLEFSSEFDLALILCEGGFSLMETDEMNYEILRGASNSLRQGGKLVMTTLNGLFPLFHSVKEFFEKSAQDGHATYAENTFDLMTFRDHNITTVKDDSGNDVRLDCNERYYIPSEMTWLLRSLGFANVEIFGAKLGNYSREHKLSTEDYEMLIVASK